MKLAAIVSLGLGALLLAQGSWIHAKAWLAQQLLEQAWTQTLRDGGPHKPWPWADHWPVARLRLPGQAQSLIVLEGDQGHALAFGPGHNPQSGLGADARTIIISGHWDTHFDGLRSLSIGDEVGLQTPAGWQLYQVRERLQLDATRHRLPILNDRRLGLVTCAPGMVPGGPERLVFLAEPAGAAITESLM